jgi:hypothetical protein
MTFPLNPKVQRACATFALNPEISMDHRNGSCLSDSLQNARLYLVLLRIVGESKVR